MRGDITRPEHMRACPFCGSRKIEVLEDRICDTSLFDIRCGECAATLPGRLKRHEALTEWNTRADGPGTESPA